MGIVVVIPVVSTVCVFAMAVVMAMVGVTIVVMVLDGVLAGFLGDILLGMLGYPGFAGSRSFSSST